MNQGAIKTIGKKQTSRGEALLFMVDKVEGLMDTLDKDFWEWSDFVCWEKYVYTKMDFIRAMDVYGWKKIDIRCCCEAIDFNQSELKNISNQKCYGIKSAYMIEKVVDEITIAKARRESDGTYST